MLVFRFFIMAVKVPECVTYIINYSFPKWLNQVYAESNWIGFQILQELVVHFAFCSSFWPDIYKENTF